MKFSIITIFPELITSYTDESILGRAQEEELISVDTYDPREFTDDKHGSMDAPPYGGGPGMVMQAQPILRAVSAAHNDSGFKIQDSRVFVTSARGKQFDNDMAEEVQSDVKHTIIICGRYEGIDERVIKVLNPTLVSVGPYILTGGELPALIIVDAVSRFVPDVLGNEDSLEENRISGAPVYTRPQTIEHNGEEYSVPDVLLSGHHEKIRQWRTQKSKSKNQNSNKEKEGS